MEIVKAAGCEQAARFGGKSYTPHLTGVWWEELEIG